MDGGLLPVELEDPTFWAVTLGIGAVVILALVALLTMLVLYLRDIDARAHGAWQLAQRLAAAAESAPRDGLLGPGLDGLEERLEAERRRLEAT